MTEFRTKGKGKDRRIYPVNKVNKKPFGVPREVAYKDVVKGRENGKKILEKVRENLMSYDMIKKIANERVSLTEMGESSIGGLVAVRIWKPDGEITVGYTQSGSDDGLDDSSRLEIDLPRENVWDYVDGIVSMEDLKENKEKYNSLSEEEKEKEWYDEYNNEALSSSELLELAADNGVYYLTERELETWLSREVEKSLEMSSS